MKQEKKRLQLKIFTHKYDAKKVIIKEPQISPLSFGEGWGEAKKNIIKEPKSNSLSFGEGGG